MTSANARAVPRALSALAIALGLAACRQTAPATGPDRAADRAEGTGSEYQMASINPDLPGVQPGIHPQVVWGTRHNPFVNEPAAAQEGRRLFVAYNCAGCHGGRAGGGMGPSLRDSVWTYGSSDTQLLSTIMEGRSAGMPAWGARIPEQQIWKLITYIRTLGTPQEPDPPPPAANPPLPAPSGVEGKAAASKAQ